MNVHSDQFSSANGMTRRQLLRAAAATGVGLAGAASLAQKGLASTLSSAGTRAARGAGLSNVKLQLSWVEDVEFAGEYIALSEGLYQKEGVQVSMLPGGPNVSVVPQVISGAALIGNGKNAQDIAAARAQGAPIQIIAALYQKNPLTMLYLKKNPVRNPQAMIGKRVGVAQNDQGAFDALLKINNISPSKVKVVPVQFDPTPLVNGEVDAFLSFAGSQPVELIEKGIPVGYWLLADFGYAGYNGAYYALEKTIQEQKSLLVDFMKADLAGWQKNIANPALGTKLTVEKYGKSLGLTYKSQLDGNKAYIQQLMQTPVTKQHGLGWMSPSDIAKNIRTYKLAGVNADASLFNLDILKAVYEGKNKVTVA